MLPGLIVRRHERRGQDDFLNVRLVIVPAGVRRAEQQLYATLFMTCWELLMLNVMCIFVDQLARFLQQDALKSPGQGLLVR